MLRETRSQESPSELGSYKDSLALCRSAASLRERQPFTQGKVSRLLESICIKQRATLH
jgi:hypothetical protein